MVFRFFSGTLEPRVDDALDFSGEFFMEGFGLVTASWGFFKVDLQCYWCETANLGDQSSFFDFIETESFECYSYLDGVRGAAHPNKFLGFNSLLLPKLLRGTGGFISISVSLLDFELGRSYVSFTSLLFDWDFLDFPDLED